MSESTNHEDYTDLEQFVLRNKWSNDQYLSNLFYSKLIQFRNKEISEAELYCDSVFVACQAFYLAGLKQSAIDFCRVMDRIGTDVGIPPRFVEQAFNIWELQQLREQRDAERRGTK